MGTETIVVVIDVSKLDEPDAGTVEVLARMQLLARRHGVTLRLSDPCPDLTGLIELAGLADVLPTAPEPPDHA